MKKLIFVVLCILVFACAAGAEHYKYGPYPNYKGLVEQTFSIIVPTVSDAYITDPHSGKSYNIGGHGGQEFEVTIQNMPLFADSFVEFDSAEEDPFDPEHDFLILTEIWGRDTNPGLPPDEVPPITGFIPMPQEILPRGPGFYIGKSGTSYPAPVETLMVADLPGRLPGYDLSNIVGPPDLVVHLSQAVVPAWDFTAEIHCDPYFLLDTEQQWKDVLDAEWPHEHIMPLTPLEWQEYQMQWADPLNEKEGIHYFQPYPDTQFLPPQLYVYEGDEDNDAGLVMTWGDATTPDGNYASAFKFEYGLDPDLTNCTIQVTVQAPQFGPSGQINQVSFAIVDINGRRRTWWWQVGPAGSGSPIQWWTPTTVTINTNIWGVAAATPVATGFLNTAGFDLTKSQNFNVDENSRWIFGQQSVPPFGQPQFVGVWNYWHNLLVTQNTGVSVGGANKGIYKKWSQPPVETETTGPDPTAAYINGWDEWSNYNNMPVMSDDWECNDMRPVTDIHWWGSFQGWNLRKMPPIKPKAFHIGIWTDVPKHDPDNVMPDPNDSHPRQLIWENYCTSYVWNFAGIDVDPQTRPEYEGETCFQFTQLLNEDEWFYQHPMADGTPNVYWLSIAAVYDANQMQSPDFHEWGWKTRPHHYNDDAVRITAATMVPLHVGSRFLAGTAIKFPQEVTWDLAFELTTNIPAYEDDPIPGDLSGPGGIPDHTVNFYDLAEIALHWLETAP